MSEQLNYTEAFSELQEIVKQFEGGEINVDVLAEKLKRASLLIEICQKKLSQTELDVQQIVQNLQG